MVFFVCLFLNEEAAAARARLTLASRSFLPEQIPCSQTWSFPHWVPSAQGKCRVMHTRWPLDFPVHHKRPHGGWMKGQGLEPSPNASSHWRSMP